ncbi:MAG: hypothetical protein II653_04360 [Lachnospiraceae bacterium]|nr:hypothetical protein [Lachnospiraceae bacterium]
MNTTFNFSKVNDMVKAYGGKPRGLIINLTQHQMVQEQYKYNDIELYEVQFKGHEKEAREDILEALTFNEIPTKEEIRNKAKTLATIAKATLNQAENLSGIHARYYALIGGAPYLMNALERALKEEGVTPLYAFSKRVSVETTQPDGSVIKTAKFVHEGYIEA